jgi:hypothetical protein
MSAEMPSLPASVAAAPSTPLAVSAILSPNTCDAASTLACTPFVAAAVACHVGPEAGPPAPTPTISVRNRPAKFASSSRSACNPSPVTCYPPICVGNPRKGGELVVLSGVGLVVSAPGRCGAAVQSRGGGYGLVDAASSASRCGVVERSDARPRSSAAVLSGKLVV